MNEIKTLEKSIKNLAYCAISNKLNGTKIPSKSDMVDCFQDFAIPKATFVTLKQNQNLRGCIGSLVAHRDLYDDLVQNAKSAAFKDPRFKPLTQEELEYTTIEISILSEPVLIKYSTIEDLKSKIDVGVDGIILKLENNQATFLPQVWDELTTFELFFEHLCQKARLRTECLKQRPIIYKYQVEKIK